MSLPVPPPHKDGTLDELAIIDRYFRPLAGEGAFDLRDDAARITPRQGYELVVTADMIACGVHFLPDDPPHTVARKALRVNLSDLAAKGAAPLGYLLSLGLTDRCGEEWLAAFAGGLAEDQRVYGAILLGGDTVAVQSGPVLSITAFGWVPAGQMVHRFGGTPGDGLYVSGSIGGAAVGLALSRGDAGPWRDLPADRRQRFVERFRVPEPRIALASVLSEHASAAMDVSDGLVGDCDKLAAASGCSAFIEAADVPLAAGLSSIVDDEVLASLLGGGDDYEILAAVPAANGTAFETAAAAAGVPVARIGTLTAGNAPTVVLWHGNPFPLLQRSYVHRRGPGP